AKPNHTATRLQVQSQFFAQPRKEDQFSTHSTITRQRRQVRFTNQLGPFNSSTAAYIEPIQHLLQRGSKFSQRNRLIPKLVLEIVEHSICRVADQLRIVIAITFAQQLIRYCVRRKRQALTRRHLEHQIIRRQSNHVFPPSFLTSCTKS